MKTIKQLADEIGVSKQAIFYRINKPPLSSDLQHLMIKQNGVLMIDVDGETLIKQAFNTETIKNTNDKQTSKETGSLDGELIQVLKESLTQLQKQLEIKDKQIEDLHKALENSQLLQAGTIQLSDNTNKKLITEQGKKSKIFVFLDRFTKK